MSNNFLRGSEWRRWDLHIHTKGTNKNDLFNASVDFNAFCVTMFKKALEKKIAAIGITDYFSIDNYQKVKYFVDSINTFANSTPTGEIIFSEREKEEIKKIFILKI